MNWFIIGGVGLLVVAVIIRFKIDDWPEGHQRNVGVLATVILTIAALCCFAAAIGPMLDRHPQRQAVNVGYQVEVGDDMYSSGGPPTQEIARGWYQTLIGYAKDYPALRPAIREALADDKITYIEYAQISSRQQIIEDAKEAEVAHKQSAAARNQLRAVLK